MLNRNSQVKKLLTIAALMAAISCGNCNQEPHLRMLVGTYTDSGSEGVYLFDYNPDDASCTLLDTAKADNPSFIFAEGDFAYSVDESGDDSGVYSYSLTDSTVDVLNYVSGTGADPCNIVKKDGFVLTSDYSGGCLSVFPIKEDGTLGGRISGFYPTEEFGETESHIHCAAISPDGNYVFVTDLGKDNIYVAALNRLPELDFSIAWHFSQGHPGPRHMTFSDDGHHMYLISELDDSVCTFSYSDGELHLEESMTAYDGEGKGSADIHISPDGRFLYTSHRLKKDGIEIFSRDAENGSISPLSFCPTGIHPRNFAISPDGSFLLCACRDDNRIEIFAIGEDGGLNATGRQIDIPAPVCIQFVD